jgi:undecaprenyl-diphosphatase
MAGQRMHGVNARRVGSMRFMSLRTIGRSQRSLAPLIAITAAALIFAVLLVLVRLRWPPLESVDHGAAAGVNGLVADNAPLVTAVKAVTWLGSGGVLWTVVLAAAIILAIRRQWRLAVYVLVTGAGALVLDPVLKSLVGRLRPVVAHPIAHGAGNSFPSGHSLGSIVCYGAVLLVFLPAARGRWRTTFITVVVALVALIGISRVLLGVHYLSDVLGAWAVGITWLGITAVAFELTRRAAGEPVTDPVTEGLEPEARADLRPATPEPAADRTSAGHRGRIAAGVLVAWVLILGIVVGVGELVTKGGNGNVLGDRSSSSPPSWSGRSPRSSSPPPSSSGPGRTSRGSTSTCPPRPTRPGTWPPRAASISPSRSWSSATPAAGGGGCSSSRRSPCRSSSRSPVCTGASTTPPTSSAASCLPRSG